MVRIKAGTLAAVAGLAAAAITPAACGSVSGGGQAGRPIGSTGTGPGSSTTSPASGAPPTSAAAGGDQVDPVLVVRSVDGSVSYDGRRPATIGLSGDATNIVSHLTWTSWSAVQGVGHGLLDVDNCDPNCAQGSITKVPATIDLGSVVGGHYTAMTERAGTIVQSYSYPSHWATGAS